MTPRTLLRYNQVRRGERVDATATEEQPAKGRYFQADCLSTDLVGMYVRITGNVVGGVRQVTRVNIQDRATMPAIGIISEKSSATRCFVQTFGEIYVTSPLDMSKPFCWIGLDSRMTQSVPIPAPGGIVVRQIVGQPLDETTYLTAPHGPPTVAVG